jgi:protein-disulfide isomerase
VTDSGAGRLAVPVSSRDHVRGDADGALELVEYGDYECPYCRAAYPEVSEVERRLAGQLRFVYRHFPLVDAHPHALHAAEAAEAAGAQGQFWAMHDHLFQSTRTLEDRVLVLYARELGLDERRFGADVADHRHLEHIREDVAGGERGGVMGTPTFFVNGFRHEGSSETGSLITALERTASSRVR